jgi:hypothetical protein
MSVLPAMSPTLTPRPLLPSWERGSRALSSPLSPRWERTYCSGCPLGRGVGGEGGVERASESLLNGSVRRGGRSLNELPDK